MSKSILHRTFFGSVLVVLAVLTVVTMTSPVSSAFAAESEEVASDHTAASETPAHETESHEAHSEGEHEEHAPEIPDLLMIIQHSRALQNADGSPSTMSKFIGAVRVPFYSILTALFVYLVFRKLTRTLEKIPSRGQSLVETYVELVDNFVCSILGKEMGRKYLPFLGTLWVYIWCMNLFCLVPLGFSPTSVIQQTFGLSITVFLCVQFTAFRYQGPLGYLFHLAGEPRDMVGWVLVPLFLPLHVMGEFIKPVSLALRLYGNILGEDILIGVFSALGIMLIQAMGWHDPWFGFPLHLPMFALVLLGSTIQATVFTVLSTIYIYLVLPHHEDHEEPATATAH